MLPDPSPVFAKYLAVAEEAQNAFDTVLAAHPEGVACAEGCDDCCHALFDLSLVEAAYLNHIFHSTFPSGPQRSAVIERAHAADRRIHAIKRRAFKAHQSGRAADDILAELASLKVRCPLLDESGQCVMYAARPVTCRTYGAPLAIGGQGRVCGRSGFRKGTPYPTVNMDRLQDRLSALSVEFARHMRSGFAEIHTVLVPVSMALITTYDAAYFGLARSDGNRG